VVAAEVVAAESGDSAAEVGALEVVVAAEPYQLIRNGLNSGPKHAPDRTLPRKLCLDHLEHKDGHADRSCT
jgi:hypothetical protein